MVVGEGVLMGGSFEDDSEGLQGKEKGGKFCECKRATCLSLDDFKAGSNQKEMKKRKNKKREKKRLSTIWTRNLTEMERNWKVKGKDKGQLSALEQIILPSALICMYMYACKQVKCFKHGRNY